MDWINPSQYWKTLNGSFFKAFVTDMSRPHIYIVDKLGSLGIFCKHTNCRFEKSRPILKDNNWFVFQSSRHWHVETTYLDSGQIRNILKAHRHLVWINQSQNWNALNRSFFKAVVTDMSRPHFYIVDKLGIFCEHINCLFG
jgi:hypothetical protein